ncbi:hypothetical protein [uncultured Flavobacterium sp.]|uniref:hypothetical protein n=1 Tax=uncultured Flavobacterium sp. TaxID=165435 RepID=UPI0025934521|nr:hypothetical protein [uncultured Flavobacterium sp.]
MIAQGSDVKINVTVTQSYKAASGRKITTPVDLSSFQGYLVFLYSKATNTVIERYSLNAVTGYEPINVISASNGQFQLFLDKDVTTSAPIGQMYGELKTSLSDSDFSLNSYVTVAKFNVDEIVESVTNGVNPAL